jgi:hypothetical protein
MRTVRGELPGELLSLAGRFPDVQGSQFRRKASISNNSFQYTQFERKLLHPYKRRTPATEIVNSTEEKHLDGHVRCADERDSMRAVLPGKPRAKLQAVCTGCWEGRRLIVRSPCLC